MKPLEPAQTKSTAAASFNDGGRPSSTQLKLSTEIIVDSRRAAWLPQYRILVVADTHLGFAWVQRQRHQLIPLVPDDAVDRLQSLLENYPARTLVVLGDVVHAAVATHALEQVLRDFCLRLHHDGRALVFVLGNHDRGLAHRLDTWKLPARAVPEFKVAGFRLVHGDQGLTETRAGERILSGHEHPCLELGDGVATRAKVPCFLWSADHLVFPAFSNWAAGSIARPGQFLGPIAAAARFTEMIACLGPRLLRLPFPFPPFQTSTASKK